MNPQIMLYEFAQTISISDFVTIATAIAAVIGTIIAGWLGWMTMNAIRNHRTPVRLSKIETKIEEQLPVIREDVSSVKTSIDYMEKHMEYKISPPTPVLSTHHSEQVIPNPTGTDNTPQSHGV